MTDYEIKPGTIRISTVDQVVDAPNFKVWHIECDSKYVEVLSYGHDDSGTFEVLLGRGEYTIKHDESTDVATSILLKTDTDISSWDIITSGGRYTVRIAAYKAVYPE